MLEEIGNLHLKLHPDKKQTTPLPSPKTQGKPHKRPISGLTTQASTQMTDFVTNTKRGLRTIVASLKGYEEYLLAQQTYWLNYITLIGNAYDNRLSREKGELT
jgi:hypothetical protein